MRRLTSLYRSPLPTSFAASWAWFATIVVFLSTWHSHGLDSGIRGAAAVFFAWALVRELAPMRPLPSLFVPLLAIAFAIPEHTDILACGAAVVMARVASRTVGASLTWLDYVVLVPFAAWAATHIVGLPVALVLAAVIFVEESGWRSRVFGIVTLVAVIVVGSVEGTLTMRGGWDESSDGKIGLMLILAVAAFRLVITRLPVRVRVRDDRKRDWLRGANVRVARIAIVAALGAAIAWDGTDALFHLSALSAAVIAVGLGGVKLRVRRNPVVHAGSGT